MKKVLFIISTLNGGGAERAISNLSFKMSKEMKMHILVNSVSANDYPCQAKIISLGMKTVAKKNIFYQLVAFIKRIKSVSKLKREGNYDVCVSFLESANFVNILTGNKFSKIYVSVRNNLSEYADWRYKYIINTAARILYKKADKVISLSKGVEHDLIFNFRLNRDRVTTIYNGYDIDLIQKMAEKEIEPEHKKIFSNDKRVFISIGRQTDQKGQWHLIRAFAEVNKKYPETHLVLLGQGELRDYLEELVQEFGLKEKIHFLGYISNPYRYIKRSFAFVFPSLFEGFGNALVEALSCEIPVISTDYRSGAREILTEDVDIKKKNRDEIEFGDYGILVPVGTFRKFKAEDPLENSEVLLARAMLQLIENQVLYEKYANVSLNGAKRFAMDKIISQWYDIL